MSEHIRNIEVSTQRVLSGLKFPARWIERSGCQGSQRSFQLAAILRRRAVTCGLEINIIRLRDGAQQFG